MHAWPQGGSTPARHVTLSDYCCSVYANWYTALAIRVHMPGAFCKTAAMPALRQHDSCQMKAYASGAMDSILDS